LNLIEFYKRKNLYYNIQKCLSVCPAINSAPGHDRDMRPVSLEPEGPDGVQREQNFTEKWPVAELPKIEFTPLMLFYGKNLLRIFSVHFEQALRLVINKYLNWKSLNQMLIYRKFEVSKPKSKLKIRQSENYSYVFCKKISYLLKLYCWIFFWVDVIYIKDCL
jgi:hypothetical protein